MVRVIMGVKGTGKTKQMIDLINSAVNTENGNVVCIERGSKLTYDVNSKIRLVESDAYDITNYDMFKGFVSGLYAANFDTTHIFIDSLTKIVKGDVCVETENFLNWLDTFGEKNGIKFTVSVSGDPADATEGMQKYL